MVIFKLFRRVGFAIRHKYLLLNTLRICKSADTKRSYVLFLILLFATILISCGGHRYPRSLVKADSVCEKDPDKAMLILDSMRNDTAEMKSDAKWYYRLLCLKTKDKLYKKHTSDNEIMQIVQHYENEGDKHMLIEAYYYAASVYRDLYDAPQALHYFNKAEELIEDGKQLKLRSMISNQRGHILLKQDFINLAIKNYLKAYEYDKLLKDTDNSVYSLIDLAYAYSVKRSIDTSMVYYKKAFEIAKKTKRKDLENDILLQMAGTYANNKQFKEALEIVKKNYDEINMNVNYSITMTSYFGIGQLDSAYKYGNRLLDIGTIQNKADATLCMVKVFKEKENTDSLMKYLNLFKQYNDSAVKQQAQEAVARANALFNFNIKEKENKQLKMDNMKKSFIALCTISALVLIVCIVTGIALNINIKRKRQFRLLCKLKKAQYEQTEEFRQENKKRISQLEETLNTYKNKNDELTFMLEKQKEELVAINAKSEKEMSEREHNKELLAKTEIYNKVKNRLAAFKTNQKSAKILSTTEFEELDKAVNEIYEGFKATLYSMAKLSTQEYHICLLIRIGLGVVDTSFLIGRTPSAVSIARKRLYTKITKEEGTAAQLDEFIKSL